MPAARLVEIWNSLPGVTPVSKFKDRNTAVTRIWKAIQTLGVAESSEAEQEVVPAADSAPEPEANLAAETTVPASDTAADVAPQKADVAPEPANPTDDATQGEDVPVAPAAIDKDECTRLLQIAALAQTGFWSALRGLESAIGFQIGDPGDLKEATVETLLAHHEARHKPRQRSQATRGFCCEVCGKCVRAPGEPFR